MVIKRVREKIVKYKREKDPFCALLCAPGAFIT